MASDGASSCSSRIRSGDIQLVLAPNIMFQSPFWCNSCASSARFLTKVSYLWHGRLALESPPHAIVDTLRLPPARVNAFESIALVSVEALGVCSNRESLSATSSSKFNRWQCAPRLTQLKQGEEDSRFLTMATCLFAATMVNIECDGFGRRKIVDGGSVAERVCDE
jgi:hypothetical protein